MTVGARARSRPVAGAMWSSAGVATQALGQFVVLAVLARALAPSDFGVATASLILVGLARLATTEGVVGPAVTQRRELKDEHVHAAFLLSVATGCVATTVTWFLAPAAAAFFDMPSLVQVVRALALTLILQSFAAVPLALLLRTLRFKAVAVVDAGSFVLGFALIGCLLAVAGAGVWALVWAYVGQAVLQTALLVMMRRHAVRWRAPWWAVRDLLVFGSGHTLARYLNYVALQGDFVVVGRYLSDAALGVYGRAYQLAAAPAVLVGGVLDKVLFPTLSARQGDPDRVARDYLRAVNLSVCLTAPLGVLLVILAPELVPFVLGPGWSDVVLPLQVVALTLTFRTGYKVGDSLAKAKGAVFPRAARQAIYAVAVVGGAYAARPWGVPGVAVAVAGAITLNYVTMAALGLRLTGLGWGAFLSAHGRGLLIALLTAVGAGAATALSRASDLPSLVTVALGALGALLCVGVPTAVRPRRVLGADVVWLLANVARRRGALGPPTGAGHDV